MRLTIVDVFAERKYAGNQLAVVQDAQSLDTETMQTIAREMNYSETTFVLDESPSRATVRIFTPEWELPFAGHPTVGTAWVLAGGCGDITLDLPVGPVPVAFAEDGIGWMTPPEPSLKEHFEPAAAAELVGLTVADLDVARYPARLAEVGPKFLLVGVNSLKALQAAKLNETVHTDYLARGVGVQCVFVFTSEAYSTLQPPADFASRMFFNSGGVREDPATGSANSAFAAYLRDLQGGLGKVVVDQGVEIKRPSRLYLNIGASLQVGGRVFETVRGELS